MIPQVLINALIVHVEFWYGRCPVRRLIVHWNATELRRHATPDESAVIISVRV